LDAPIAGTLIEDLGTIAVVPEDRTRIGVYIETAALKSGLA
jgi:hypothetical protein